MEKTTRLPHENEKKPRKEKSQAGRGHDEKDAHGGAVPASAAYQ